MDEIKLKEVIEQLRQWGVIFDKGLSTQEIKDIEREGKFRFPEDLRMFLQLALPIWQQDYEDRLYISELFPNWRTRGSLLIRMSQRWLLQGILAHVNDEYKYEGQENGPRGTWLGTWGPRPSTVDEAFTIVERLFAQAPILVPVYMHGFIPTEPIDTGNPVFLVMGTDIVHGGSNLAEFFYDTYGRYQHPQRVLQPGLPIRRIKFWDDFVYRTEQEPPVQPHSMQDIDLSKYDDLMR